MVGVKMLGAHCDWAEPRLAQNGIVSAVMARSGE
jgi:hypothetical protein